MASELTETAYANVAARLEDGIAEVTIRRPAARNALDTSTLLELTDVARRLRLRHDVLAVVLSGAETYFSAGADLKSVRERIDRPTLLESREAVMAGPDLCRAWEEIEAVTIAAIEGYCIGGACALAVACDFRVMARSAYLRLPEVPLGINMSWRTLPRLVALMGPARAKRFVMFGEPLGATDCAAWGACDELTDDGDALPVARRWAEKARRLPPLPVRMTKEAVNAIASAGSHAGIYMDRDQYLLTTRTEDYREAVEAFFARREPIFQGR
jgi:enoyl-CoA hydratase/carnithine racemase